jgi:hypothetical protein
MTAEAIDIEVEKIVRRIDDMADTSASTRPFALIGAEYIHPCAHCGSSDGQVYLVRDGVKSHPLHEGCAAAFFGREGSVRIRSPLALDDRHDPDG